MTNKHYRTRLSTYNEAEALQQLMQTINTALSDERFKQYEDDVMSDEILITIGGVQTAFYLGGPQVDGLMAFIDHIANENGYEVDFNNSTVVE
jgi:hypothetical protein